MTETFEDLIACEDVLLFLNAAITSTGQREFHSDDTEQAVSLGFLHEYMHVNYRDLYVACLALDINDHNAARVIHRILAVPGEVPTARRRMEGALIARRLELMTPPRVYRLFTELAASRINNRRTRAIIRDWIAKRPSPDLDAVKYRGGLKKAARHIHLSFRAVNPSDQDERGGFLFTTVKKQPKFDNRLLDSWRRAHYEKRALYQLPYTVAEGFAARKSIPRKEFLQGIEPMMTRLERLRLMDSAKALGVDTGELHNAPLTRIASYVLAMPPVARAERRAELTGALRAAAGRAAGDRAGSWGRTVAVLDDSFSSFGSPQKKNRPLAVALAAHYLLAELCVDYTALWLSGRDDPIMSVPHGATPLGLRLIDALELTPERLIVISDGWDNAPAGLAAAVLRTWRQRLDPDEHTSIVHLNPVYDSREFTARGLSPGVPTVGIRDARDLRVLVEFAQFAQGRTGLDELREHLAVQIDRFLGLGHAV